MNKISEKPQAYALVQGGIKPDKYAGVLGGLEGVKSRLSSPLDSVRISALYEALKYGKEGLKLIFDRLKNDKGEVQQNAYQILWKRGNQKGKQKLVKYFPARSEVGIDYTILQNALSQGKWKESDHLTALIMIQIIKEQGHNFRESVKNFPCIDLETIDQLWLNASNYRFGFSVQKRIWEDFGKNSYQLQECIGWRKRRYDIGVCYLPLSDYNFSIKAPFGHLPSWWFLGGWIDRGDENSLTISGNNRLLAGFYECIIDEGCSYLFPRLDVCHIR
jgi:hypothetical protein